MSGEFSGDNGALDVLSSCPRPSRISGFRKEEAFWKDFGLVKRKSNSQEVVLQARPYHEKASTCKN